MHLWWRLRAPEGTRRLVVCHRSKLRFPPHFQRSCAGVTESERDAEPRWRGEQRERRGGGGGSTPSQSHVTAEFPWRQQQCSTLGCSPARRRAGIRHLATAAGGCIFPDGQVPSLLSEVSVTPPILPSVRSPSRLKVGVACCRRWM